MHDHKTYHAPHRTPHQIEHAITQRDIVLAVDWTGCAGESAVVFGRIFKANFFAIDARPALSETLDRWNRQISHGIALGPRDQVMALIQQWRDDLATGVVSVGDKQHRALETTGNAH